MSDYWSKEGAVCPYCGYLNEDSGDCELYTESGIDIDCEECDKTFRVVGYMSWSWTSYKKEDGQ